MRRWQAIPVAAVAALLTGIALFSSAPPVTTHAAPAAAAPPTDQYYVALDCGSGPGVDCNIPVPASGALDVAVKFGNPAALGGPRNVAGFNFELFNPNSAQLAVGVGVPTRNPALVALNACSLPAADDDTGVYGAGTSNSFLACIDPLGAGDTMASGSVTTFGTVHYNMAATSGGSAALILNGVAVGDDNAVQIVACDADNLPPAAPIVTYTQCANVTINFTGAPTATNTPVPPTATNTSVPTITPTPGTPTTLAYVTVTPTGSPTVAATATPPAGTTPAATVSTGGGGTGTTPGGGAGAGGAGPIRLPDTGSGSERGTDWTFAAMVALLALGAGGVAGSLYFGAASAAQGQRSRREG